jgi:hypothetical protein
MRPVLDVHLIAANGPNLQGECCSAAGRLQHNARSGKFVLVVFRQQPLTIIPIGFAPEKNRLGSHAHPWGLDCQKLVLRFEHLKQLLFERTSATWHQHQGNAHIIPKIDSGMTGASVEIWT